MSSSFSSPRRYPFDSGGRLYGGSSSAPISVIAPSNPFFRAATAAFPPARPAPMTTRPGCFMKPPADRSLAVDKIQKLRAHRRVVAKLADQARGDGVGIELLDAAHLDAQVPAIHDHRHSARAHHLIDRLGQLTGQPH